MKEKIGKFLFLAMLTVFTCCLIGIFACKKAPKTQGIEITTPPTKTVYVEGELFDPAGMEVKKILSDDSTEVITDYTVDKTAPLTLADTTVTVSYGEFTDSLTITVEKAFTPTELQVLALPDKTEYIEGESFNPAGMEIYALTEDGNRVKVDDYTVDKTVLTTADTYVTVSYKSLTVKVNVTVKADKPERSVTDVLLYSGEDFVYNRTMDVSSIIKYKAVYSDGTTDEDWTYSSAEDLNSYKIEGNNLVLNVSLFVKNKEFTRDVTVPISDNGISVAELKAQNPDGETVYMLDGVVVALASTMSRAEYIIYDEASGEFIGVTDIKSNGSISALTFERRYETGDRICIPVTLVKTAVKAKNSDSEKIYAKYAGGSLYETAVIQHNYDYTVAKDNAMVINGQSDLQNMLNADNRSQNHYKFVKINGPINCIKYGTSPVHYRFFYEGVNTLAAQKVDNCSPVFMNANQSYITGNTIGEMFVGDANWAPSVWSAPETAYVNVCALYIGGNTYYHEFVILDAADVTPLTPTPVSYNLTEPEKLSYVIGDTLDLSGGKIEITYSFGPATQADITTEMLDPATIPDMTTSGQFTIRGTYEGYNFSFTITVNSGAPDSIALDAAPDKNFELFYGFEAVAEELAKHTLTAKFGSTEKTVNIDPSMLTLKDGWAAGTQTVIITYLGVTTEVQVTVTDSSVSVTEIKTKPAGEDVYLLKGVVVSSAFISGTLASPSNGELLLKDTANSNVIGVKGLVTKADTPLGGYSAGDELIIKVTIGVTTTSATTSECGKLAAFADEGSTPCLLSRGNNISLALDSATAISSQSEFEQFLAKDVRKDNAYKLVKFTAGTKFVFYNNSYYITFDGTSVATVKIDGIAPFLHIMNESMTLGDKTYKELLVGTGAGTFADPIILDKDVYLMYIGGQGKYYHQFILLGAEYISGAAKEA